MFGLREFSMCSVWCGWNRAEDNAFWYHETIRIYISWDAEPFHNYLYLQKGVLMKEIYFAGKCTGWGELETVIFTHCFPSYKQPSWCKMLFCLLWLLIHYTHWWVNMYPLFLVIEEIVRFLMYVKVCSHIAYWKITKILSKRETHEHLIFLPLDKVWGCWGKLSSTRGVKLGQGRRGSGQTHWHSLT